MLVTLAGAAFLWFQWRPARIRAACTHAASFNAAGEPTTTDLDTLEKLYQLCLHASGLYPLCLPTTHQEAPGATQTAPDGPSLPTATQRFSPALAQAIYERELAYYRADAPFLPIEKCAERCRRLSLLLATIVRSRVR